MADPQRAQEPSMEEILASIRRIISDDGDGDGASGQEGAQEMPEPDVNEDNDADMAAMMEDTAAEAAQTEPEEEFEVEAEPDEAGGDEEDVFELTDDMAATEPEGEPEDDTVSQDDLDKLFAGEDEPEPEPEPEAEADDIDIDFADIAEEAEAPQPAPPAEPEEPVPGLLSTDAQATASAAFGALASTMLSHSGGARTLEQIVEDLLRPLLKSWLDENLPALVEKMVREEIERVARRAR
ncbi:MAG: DUF2497 domain-containing protein [Rhizobiales bacterium]|nr:DUF2497 domain-containing protein [Hyphomicrobiales bacterium]